MSTLPASMLWRKATVGLICMSILLLHGVVGQQDCTSVASAFFNTCSGACVGGATITCCNGVDNGVGRDCSIRDLCVGYAYQALTACQACMGAYNVDPSPCGIAFNNVLQTICNLLPY